MCGIAGVLAMQSKAPFSSAEIAARMNRCLAHRGPDDTGLWHSADGQVALAHSRLSIIDLSPMGRNPMSWGNRLWITFNGEIYNYREIRQEAERRGHEFRSQTDTEVILAAYDEWGLDAASHLVGMFAFGLWDENRKRLWLVRDRVGKKPLYYTEHGGVFRFASELKAILADEQFPREIDRTALRLFLRYGYIPAPFTIFTHAKKLPPAHWLVHEQGQATITRYWDPFDHVRPEGQPTDSDALREIEARLSLAVRQRLIADVPLGAFLSGGVDSSLIVAMMQEHTTTPVRTFTVRFRDSEFDESTHAAAVARHLGTDHVEETCDEADMLGIVDKLPEIFDEPHADSSAIPTYLVSRAARRHVTVALSGDGGDELFWGYPRYRYHSSAKAALLLPQPLRRAAAAAAAHLPTRRLRRISDVLANADSDTYASFVTLFGQQDVEALTGATSPDAPLYQQARQSCAELDSATIPALLDFVTYLPDDILVKVDRASMALGLEVRSPLLDHHVVEFALGLPMAFKQRGGETKWLLKQLLYKRVPRRLVDRPKQGFGVPLRAWLLGPLRAQMDDYCRSGDLLAAGINPEPVREIWRQFTAGVYRRPDLLWQLFVLSAWTRRYLTASGNVERWLPSDTN